MSGIKGWIVVTEDCRVLCRIGNLLTLLPMGPELNVSDVCLSWKDTLDSAMKMWIDDDFCGRPSLDFDPGQVKLELVEAEINQSENKLYIL